MHSKTPESSSDFERVLLGSPNSSYLWIQYMSFQLQLSEIDKAREIAKRALSTISFPRGDGKAERLDRAHELENVYGTEESLESVFKDAARHCEPKTVHLRLASILEESGKHEVKKTKAISCLLLIKKSRLLISRCCGGRTQKNSSSGLAKNSGKAPKSGRCSANTT
jgi:hypothetical protein